MAFLFLGARPAQACFADYYAPRFLDLTDATIAVGVVTTVVSLILALKRRAFVFAVAMLFAYFALSYYGHWAYNGDCGAQIVQLNRYALVVASLWFGTEALLLIYQNKAFKA